MYIVVKASLRHYSSEYEAEAHDLQEACIVTSRGRNPRHSRRCCSGAKGNERLVIIITEIFSTPPRVRSVIKRIDAGPAIGLPGRVCNDGSHDGVVLALDLQLPLAPGPAHGVLPRKREAIRVRVGQFSPRKHLLDPPGPGSVVVEDAPPSHELGLGRNPAKHF